MPRQKTMGEEIKKLKNDIKKNKRILNKISIENVVRDIRGDRESR